jgi:starch synthase
MNYDTIWGLTITYQDLWVPWYGGPIHCSVWFGFVNGRKCFFIEPHSNENFFSRRAYYGCADDAMRFAFFTKAAMEFLLKSGKRPEIIHVHDWQTALAPVLLYEMYREMDRQRVCFTIHNFRHQGVIGGDALRATGLNRPEFFFRYEQMRDNANAGALNFMKGGIVYANFTTTVSPRHAWEARNTDQGCGMQPTLKTHQNKFGGVLNGVDCDEWNPEIDTHIPVHFTRIGIEGKYKNKDALRERLMLKKEYKPLIACIGRLDQQKGLHLIKHALFYAMRHGAQFVLLGVASNNAIAADFGNVKRQINDNPDSHVELGFNEDLAHLLYAGADMLFVPSMFEPCGLTQMIAMKYGTVPVVRGVGGMVDTVFDKDLSTLPPNERNGYVFSSADNKSVESTLDRAISCWYKYPKDWRVLMENGMKYDYSWNLPGQHYINIYEHIRCK